MLAHRDNIWDKFHGHGHRLNSRSNYDKISMDAVFEMKSDSDVVKTTYMASCKKSRLEF